MKFVDLDIEPAGEVRREPLAPILAELADNPGRWGELDRYPSDRIASARSRGSQIKKRYPGTEYAVVPEGDVVVLYLRKESAP
jgi:hypothetical protein